MKGLFSPGTWELERTISAEDLIVFLTNQTETAINQAILNGLEQQGLSLYQGIILASIIEREAVLVEEMPMIASVFLNRLEISMKLETDPTVQYAVGYNPVQNTWWTNPLSLEDLKVNSRYNTYLYPNCRPRRFAAPVWPPCKQPPSQPRHPITSSGRLAMVLGGTTSQRLSSST